MSNGQIVISALSSNVDKENFDCGNESLNNYIKCLASQDVKRKISVVYTATVGGDFVGFYSLSAISVEAIELPKNIAKKLPRYPISAAIIGRLAVDINSQGNGLGGILLIDAIKKSIKAGEFLAIHSIIVDAKDESAKKFYEHYGFLPLQTSPMRLFLSVETAKEIMK